jgi:hypothetical protein
LTGVGATKSEAATLGTKPVGSVFYKSGSLDDHFTVQDYQGKTVWAKTTNAVTLYKLSSLNQNFAVGTVTFIDYDKVGTKWVKYTKTANGYFWFPVKDGITLAEYNKVKTGMTYNQVWAITGETMTLVSSTSSGGYVNKDYNWEYEKWIGDNYIYKYVDFDFENNKLWWKSQVGLN